jgi:hypothetical protein
MRLTPARAAGCKPALRGKDGKHLPTKTEMLPQPGGRKKIAHPIYRWVKAT